MDRIAYTDNSLPQDAISKLFMNSNPVIDESLNGWSKVISSVGIENIDTGETRAFLNHDVLATLFTPYYHISAGEWANFVTLKTNQDTMEVAQYHGQTPVNYYRAHPMGFKMINGTQYGFYKLDYITIWDADYGLALNPYAIFDIPLLNLFYEYSPYLYYELITLNVINDIKISHPWDTERSALLVGAPVTSYNTYNTNPNAYYVHSMYAAAHEGTFTDRSSMVNFITPIQATPHLFLSLNKHATYFCNPHGIPLMPQWLIDECYWVIQLLYTTCVIDYHLYSSFLFCLDYAFYSGIIERFYARTYGDGIASIRTNVGEPIIGQILNGCNFIMDKNNNIPNVYSKLMTPLWIGFTIPLPSKCDC